MATTVHQRIARGVIDRAEQAAQRHRQSTLADVLSLAPWRLELHDQADVLQAGVDPLVLTQWVRWYHHNIGIKAGDTAVVDLRHGVWVWHDVLSDSAIS